MSYMHKGFWQCMDNKREKDLLEKLLKMEKHHGRNGKINYEWIIRVL